MAIGPGTRIGPYEVTALLGEGGMGKVWRAHHTGLKRDDALKVLPEAFASDPERLARFQREAQVLASLNHPNIAHVHGLEESDGTRALVMELVEGPTLADRIAKGPIPIDDALPIGRQVAEALEAAHEQGIIHRDLKPANIKLRPDGTVKVLDFGLAKALDQASASGLRATADLTASPTITSPAMTQIGVILGTAAYMSPEQAKGRSADKRSDIWAFGCVLYEMLTGTRAFEGEDVSDTLAAVLRGEPHWDGLPADIPAAIRALIKQCLEKDRRQRVGDVAAALFVLREPTVGSPRVPVTSVIQTPPLWRRATPFVMTAAVVGALGVFVDRTIRPTGPPPLISRSVFNLPAGQGFVERGSQMIAISRDGTKMAYWANQRVYVRSMAEFDAKPVAGTETQGATAGGDLAFSPDGRAIAFWTGNPGTARTAGTLKRVAVEGGSPILICETSFVTGMSWGSHGIVFSRFGNDIMRVADAGGQPERLLAVNGGLVWGVQLLPGEEDVLFSFATDLDDPAGASMDSWDRAQIVVQSLKSGRRTTIREGSAAMFLPTGHLLYVVGGVLFGIPFDLKRMVATGGPVPVVEGVRRPNVLGAAPGTVYYAVSDTGSLIYVPGPVSVSSAQRVLVFSDRKGSNSPVVIKPGAYQFPRISPDGKRVAVGTDDGKTAEIYVYDLSGSNAPRQLTLGGKNRFPVWSPDGQWVAFQSDREGDLGIFRQRADGGSAPERLTKPEKGTAHFPESWSSAGRTLSFSEKKGDAFALWILSMTDKKATPFSDVRSKAPITSMFSPDGRWVAYTVDSTIYVQEATVNGIRHPIVTGAFHPLWSRDGSELFYRMPGSREEVVKVATKPSFSVSNPEAVSLGLALVNARGRNQLEYDISSDGKQFIGVTGAGQHESGDRNQINVVLHWFEELKQRVPTQ